MKNKNFSLIEYLKSKGFFITKDNIKDKKFLFTDATKTREKKFLHQAAQMLQNKKPIKKPIQYVDVKSRIWTFKPIPQVTGGKLIFVDFKNKVLLNNKGIKKK